MPNFLKKVTLLLTGLNAAFSRMNPFPNQVIKIGASVNFDMSPIFSDDYRMLWAEGNSLPGWLRPEYKTRTYDEVFAEKVFVEEGEGAPNTAYVTNGNLHILDISDPDNITELSTYATKGYSTEVVVSGGLAYLLADDLLILNVNNPRQPSQLSKLPIKTTNQPGHHNSAITLSASKTIAYVQEASDLHSISIGDPTNPQRLGRYALPLVDAGPPYAGMAIFNDNLFVTHPSGLFVINVSNPTRLTLKKTFMGSGYQGIALYGDRAYIAAGANGLDILDVGDLNDITRISNHKFDRAAMAQDVVVFGNIAFVSAAYFGFLQILDVADPSNPKVILNLPLSSIQGGKNLALAGSHLLIPDDGLRMMDLRKLSLTGMVKHIHSSDEVFPITVNALPEAGYPISDTFTIRVDEPPFLASTINQQSLTPDHTFTLPLIAQELLKAPEHNKIFYSLSLMNNNPLPSWLNLTQDVELVGEFAPKRATESSDNHVGVFQTTVFTSFAAIGLQMINLQDLSSPQAMGRLTSATCGLAMADDFAFSQHNDTLLALSPFFYELQPLGFYENPSCELAYASGTLYATDSQYVYFLDVSALGNIKLLHKMPAANSAFAVSEKTKTLVLVNQTGLRIWDVRNASQPELLSTTPVLFEAGKVLVSQDLLLIGDLRTGCLQIFNISNLLAPEWLSRYPVGNVSGIAVSESQKTVFLATGNRGLQALNIQNPSDPKLVFSYTDANHVNDVAVFSPKTTKTTLVIVDQIKGLQILNISNNWKIQARPTVEDAGNYYFRLTVTNNEFGSSESTEFMLRVEGKPQVVQNAVPARLPTTVFYPFFYSLLHAFTHPNRDFLAYQVFRAQNKSLGLGWLHFDPISGSIGGTPTDHNVNEIIDLQLIATDPQGHKAFAWMNVSVEQPKAEVVTRQDSDSPATWILRIEGLALALFLIAYAYKNRTQCWNAVQRQPCVRFFKPKVHPVEVVELPSVNSDISILLRHNLSSEEGKKLPKPNRNGFHPVSQKIPSAQDGKFGATRSIRQGIEA